MHKRKGVDICVRAMSVLHTSINLEKNKIEKNTGVTDKIDVTGENRKDVHSGGTHSEMSKHVWNTRQDVSYHK